MVLVYEDKKRKVVKGQERIDFSSFSSFHLVVITARVKGKKQISQSATDDEDLIVKIDDKSFPKLNTNRLKDSPATFSGGQLHNLSKTVYYLTFLKGKDHTIVLEADDPPGTVSFESLEVYTLVPEKKTVDDPKWTEDFYDDPENILLARLIFGEAENQPKEAKLGVGFTVISRVGKQRTNWGVTVRGVILKESQYDALWNPDRRNAVRDPLRGADETTREAWNESYAAATGILDSSLTDPTDGATHFHSYPEDKPEKFPSWATEENFKIKIGDILFYELER